MELTSDNQKEGCSCGKTMLTTGWHASPGVAVLVFKKGVLVSEFAGVKAVETKTKTKIRKATQRKRDVLKVLLVYQCRCGEVNAESGTKYVACVDGIRRSRCPSLKANQGCGTACVCKNCGNPNGKNEKIVAIPVGRKRKRESRSPYKRVRSADFLASVNVQPSQKLWTAYEQ